VCYLKKTCADKEGHGFHYKYGTSYPISIQLGQYLKDELCIKRVQGGNDVTFVFLGPFMAGVFSNDPQFLSLSIYLRIGFIRLSNMVVSPTIGIIFQRTHPLW
jgi:hypothetical protein